MRDTPPDRPPSLGTRLIHAARALEAGGIYNAAKILRGLAASEEIRASLATGEPVAPEERGRELMELIPALRAAGYEEEIVKLVEHGRLAALEDRIIPLEETPAVFVCRTCGRIAVSRLPERCPECGARRLTWHEIPPVYFLEPLSPGGALAGLKSIAEDVEASVRGLTEDEMAQAPGPGEWAVRDVLFHLLTAQSLLAGRVEKILSEDMPFLEGLAAWAEEASQALAAGEILARYRDSRQATIDRLGTIAGQDWWRQAHHSEFGVVTLLQQTSYFAKHDASHLPQIDAIRAALGA